MTMYHAPIVFIIRVFPEKIWQNGIRLYFLALYKTNVVKFLYLCILN